MNVLRPARRRPTSPSRPHCVAAAKCAEAQS